MIRQHCQHVHPAEDLRYGTQSDLLKVELLPDHAKRILTHGTGLDFDGFVQILQPFIW
jgi:hypothetical protein